MKRRDAQEIGKERELQYPATVCSKMRKMIMGGEYRAVATGAFCSQAATGARKQRCSRQKGEEGEEFEEEKYASGARKRRWQHGNT